MADTPSLVATLTSPLDEAMARSLAAFDVAWLEVRADLLGELEVDRLREQFDGRLLYTLRSRAEGGAFEGGRAARKRRLVAAAAEYDLIDLEADRDLEDDVLEAIDPERRLLSWHGPATHLTGLRDRFVSMAETRARYYKMIPTAERSGDDLRVLTLLDDLGRDDLIAFAAGDIGTWTRIVAPQFGSPLVYGALGDTPGAPGQLTVAELVETYDLPRLHARDASGEPLTKLHGIAGRPVSGSLSPRLWNGAFRELGIRGVYVPFHVESFGDFWLEVVESNGLGALGLPLVGLSVTSPYKSVALAVSGASSPRAQHIEAANTLCCGDPRTELRSAQRGRTDDGPGEVWEAETTDPDGVVLAFTHAGIELRDRRAAVLGCGGAGKAAAYGLQLAGAKVTLFNRDPARGERASAELRLPFVPLAEFDPSRAEIVVDATAAAAPLFDPAQLPEGAAVLDMGYSDEPTELVRRTREAGRVGIDGREMLLYQALEQFRLVTGHELPEAMARRLLWRTPIDSANETPDTPAFPEDAR